MPLSWQKAVNKPINNKNTMSKKDFKKAMRLNRVEAIPAKAINRGTREEKTIYDIYQEKR